MCPRRRERILDRVDGTTIVTLELRLTHGLLTGTAASDGTVREFAGWLGLVGALDALVPHVPAPPLRCREEAAVADATDSPPGRTP